MKHLIDIFEILRPDLYDEKHPFTVGKTTSNRILLFDIDDTILKSTAKTFIKKDGKVIRELTPAEYNYYKLKPGEEFDYTEFRDINIMLRSIMLTYWDTLKREYRKGTHIAILTARGDIDMLKKFFLQKGINIKQDLIFAVGDESLGLRGTIEDKKAKILERLYDVGYRTFVFFDDNVNNLEAAKKMEQKLPIKVHIVKA